VVPDGWDPRTAIARCPIIAWQGAAWRIHRQRYLATDPGGSLKVSGRYHRGTDRFAAGEAWPALYLALSPETALGELVRHLTPELLPHLNGYRISELAVSLEGVADCRDAMMLGVSADVLLGDVDYTVTQQLGAAVVEAGLEGLLVPSATELGDNLVIFPEQLREGSRLTIVKSRDPRLHVNRS
jgi:RES domain-containing protein